MSDGQDTASLTGLLGARLLLSVYVPLAVALVPMISLLASGAPADFEIERLVDVVVGAAFSHVATIAVLIFVVSLALQPHLGFVERLWTGRWMSRLPGAERLRRRAQRNVDAVLTAEVINLDDAGERAGVAWNRHRRYPDPPIRLTSLGNALAASSDRVQRRFGLEADVVWPYLRPLFSSGVRAMVDDRRLALDTAMAMTAALAAVGVEWVVFVGPSRSPWTLAAFALFVLTYWTYRAAVVRAVEYGDAIEAAVQLSRFDLYAHLRVEQPESGAHEKEVVAPRLNEILRSVHGFGTFVHPTAPLSTGPPAED